MINYISFTKSLCSWLCGYYAVARSEREETPALGEEVGGQGGMVARDEPRVSGLEGMPPPPPRAESEARERPCSEAGSYLRRTHLCITLLWAWQS
jgi:hypothetical protein